MTAELKDVPGDRYVFKYKFDAQGRPRLVRAYRVVEETDNHVLVRHWYGLKRWHAKGECWILEGDDA